MLRACFELLRPGGRLAFATIFIKPDVSDREYRRAARARGRGAASKRAVTDLLRDAGFVDVQHTDVTGAFGRTTRAFLDTSQEVHDQLRLEWGDDALDQSRSHWRKTLGVIEDGILCRGIFSARRPAR